MPQAFAKYRALFDSSKTIGQVIKDRFRFAVDYPDEYNLIQTVYRMLRRRLGRRSRITPVKSTPALKTTTRPLGRTVESIDKATVKGYGRRASSIGIDKKRVIEEAGKKRRTKIPVKKASEADDDEDED
ncbi:hypothetical protein OESDEN_10132 [Oesophagostomum dentatum]|uniref:Uncharacterized protein n=1 Tax=Oesophagostomum dentatum TaxID=61180 RepID=A0A0B1T1J7_OESDE|nr:hypothetical protein OESDEN_10132 [Oesophagostomum dentatum]